MKYKCKWLYEGELSKFLMKIPARTNNFFKFHSGGTEMYKYHFSKCGPRLGHEGENLVISEFHFPYIPSTNINKI